MKITKAVFQIHHAADGSAVFELDHGGTPLFVDLSCAERQRLGLMLLDTHPDARADAPAQETEAA